MGAAAASDRSGAQTSPFGCGSAALAEQAAQIFIVYHH